MVSTLASNGSGVLNVVAVTTTICRNVLYQMEEINTSYEVIALLMLMVLMDMVCPLSWFPCMSL